MQYVAQQSDTLRWCAEKAHHVHMKVAVLGTQFLKSSKFHQDVEAGQSTVNYET